MADDVTAPATGAVFATDEIAGRHFPKTKLAFGADGTAADVTAGNPLPVVLDAGSLAALEQITVELGATSLAALESITVAGTVEIGATSLAALEQTTVTLAAGSNAVGTVEIGAASLAALENTTVTVGSSALPAGAATEATVASTAGADNWAAVTPSDATVLSPVPKALYIGAAGNISLTGADGTAATFAVVAGQILPFRARRVRATGTTATGIVALS